MKLVLTGGPSGGKTTLAKAIQKEFSSKLIVIPEAASIVYGGGWPRRKSQVGVQHQQRAIFLLQRELESLLEFENQDRLLVCDRGSLDGLAYWPGPGPAEDFLGSLGTTLEAEVERYDWVMHLDTAPASFYDDTNPLRNETFEEAWQLNEKVKAAWAAHPRRIVIDNHENGHFMDKLRRALLVIERVIQGRSYDEITTELAK